MKQVFVGKHIESISDEPFEVGIGFLDQASFKKLCESLISEGVSCEIDFKKQFVVLRGGAAKEIE